jgi:hypothetical protein
MAQKSRPAGVAGWLLVALAWSMIVVLVVWAERILGPMSYGTRRLLVRGATVVLVVPLLLLRPAALIVAWLLACVGIVAAIPGWLRTGVPSVPLWSLVVAGVYAVGFPVLLKRMRGAERSDSPEAAKTTPEPGPEPEPDLEPPPTARRADIDLDTDRFRRYGTDLAAAVADYLQAGGAIAEAHRDYCGTGLCFHGGRFVYDDVEDAVFRSLRSSTNEPLAAFPDRQSFIAWLGGQSDDTLSGKERGEPFYGNQRITRRRLEEALANWARRRPN